MGDDTTSSTTAVTRITSDRESDEHPMMSYTAVTTHQTMAEAFIKELIRVGTKIMSDRDLSIEDVLAICHVALDRKAAGLVMLEGRHLRGRVTEQISRADRYKEPFSLMVIRFDEAPDKASYDALVDTLCERMRKTDLMFLFKTRIVLLLPHTTAEACELLTTRLRGLLDTAFDGSLSDSTSHLTYPSLEVTKSSEVLDWMEDQIRT